MKHCNLLYHMATSVIYNNIFTHIQNCLGLNDDRNSYRTTISIYYSIEYGSRRTYHKFKNTVL